MAWQKLGLVFTPSGEFPWMKSHAANPVALHLGGGLYRVYFASRDERNRSHVGYVEFDVNRPKEILRVSDEPALAPGPLGFFDDHGVYAASVVERGGELLMYYTGWNPGPWPMYYPSVGVAASRDGGRSFRKMFKSPILARSEHDPWMISQPFVMSDEGRWRMWYISGYKWETEEDGLHSYYNIKYGESEDGINWERNGLVCIGHLPGERNIARPCLLKEGGLYKAWFPRHAGRGYRIGYAESPDGYAWTRKDEEGGLDVSESGWDSEAVSYPWVFVHEGSRYMLYNGNDFGREGFGLAVEAR
ncbi:MAG: hypothetical protein M3348_10975 [Acidobacteriota bacterium]|nr:hypothetical protein [Acidobacteriota bacterium]